MKNNLLRFTGLILFSLIVQLSALAQPTYFYVGFVLISPTDPVPGEEICITVTGIKSTPCVYEETFEVYPLGGNDLALDMCFNDTSICIQILVPWDTTYCIPGLPAGNYSLILGGCGHDGMGLSFGFAVGGATAPEALFSADPPTGCGPLEVYFKNESVNADQFQWDFGDGIFSTEENPIHVFTAPGSYNVTLTAINSISGESDEGTITVTVFPSPSVDLGADTTITTEQVLTLNAGTGFSSYLWSTGATTAFLQIVGSALSPGDYTYTVTVTNAQGCEGSAQITVTVTEPSGVADLSGFPEFRVYPNPARDLLNLDTKADIQFVQWLDLTGRVLYEGVPDNRIQLRVPPVADGVYLLKAFTDEYSWGVVVGVRR